jgi:DNA end-binding protein Ku
MGACSLRSVMARSIWTGSISFGLVNIPVGLYSAVEEKTIRFHQLERGTSDRIRYKRVNETTGKEVEYQDIVKGYEVSDDQYVVLTPKELEAVEPAGSRTVEIEDFVDQAEIDPIYFDRTYYLAPRNEAAMKPYALLREAMRKAGKVGVATFVMRGKEHLAAIRVDGDGDVIALETMFFADEIREPKKELDLLPDGEAPKERELAMAVSLIDSMTAKWEPERYHDRYRARVMDLIKQKQSGEEFVVSRQPQRDTNVVDLMEALRRSVERVRDGADAEEEPAKATPATATAERREQPDKSEKAAPKAAKTKSSEQLSMLSKDELYQLAQTLDVPGRSKMSRHELELAVSKAKPEDETPTKRSARRAS